MTRRLSSAGQRACMYHILEKTWHPLDGETEAAYDDLSYTTIRPRRIYTPDPWYYRNMLDEMLDACSTLGRET